MRWFVLMPCVLVACDVIVKFDDLNIDGGGGPGDDDDDDDDTGGTDPDPVENAQLSEWQIYCDGSKEVVLAYTDGLASGARVFQQETAAYGFQWSDDHPLRPIQPDSDGRSGEFMVELQDGTTLYSPIDDWVMGQSTVFECYNHIEQPDWMTFAIGVFDSEGTLTDCVAFGHDPQGLIDGNYNGVQAGDTPWFDITQCRIE